MKRSPMSRGATHDENGKRRYSTFASPGAGLKRSAPMKRKRMRRGPAKRVTARAALAPYLAFVRTLACCASSAGGCRGRIEAAHITTSADQKGVGMKVPDNQAVPLCRRHHGDWDGRNGSTGNPFAGFLRTERYALGAEWVAATQLAAIPEDLEAAWELERLGLGEVLREVHGDGWAWRQLAWAEASQ